MSSKFIPNADAEFDRMAAAFARRIADDPARFGVQPEDARALSEVVMRFHQALSSCRDGGPKTQAGTRTKDEAREQAEARIRKLANRIRADENIEAATKLLLHIRERSMRPRTHKLPKLAPRLRFVRALHEGNLAAPVHELEFATADTYSRARPMGVARVELFTDLVTPDEPIPAWPGANFDGRPWYLRSFTRNPIVITPPLARVPMRVVYWARWADTAGNVGQFSATADANIEGGSHYLLQNNSPGTREYAPLLEVRSSEATGRRHPVITVAIRDARLHTMHAQGMLPSNAPEPTEAQQRQIEGPAAPIGIAEE